MPDSPSWAIGVASERITPALGCPMAGFDARKGVAEAVHDELHARALVFDDGGTQTALVSVEVIAVSAAFAGTVRGRVQSATGIPAANVFLSATHTHCGPVTLHHFFNQGQPLDGVYLEWLAGQIVKAVERAYAGRRTRVLKTGTVPCGIAVNRRSANGLPIDPLAGILLVEETDGAVAAVAVFYACHTTVLGPDTLSLSQDFPFYTLERLKRQLGGEVECLFFNGAEGDLSIGHKSDLSAVGIVDTFRTFATAQRLGEALADAVVEGLGGLVAEAAWLQVDTSEVVLPLKQYPPVAAMRAARERALREVEGTAHEASSIAARKRYLFARIEEYYAELAEAGASGSLAVEISAIRLNETVLLTLPGEVFVGIGLAIRAGSPFSATLFLGLTNDYIGYVPDAAATAASGYEVVAARVTAEAARVLEEAAVALLHRSAKAGRA